MSNDFVGSCRTGSGGIRLASSMHGVSHALKGGFMKKVEENMRSDSFRSGRILNEK